MNVPRRFLLSLFTAALAGSAFPRAQAQPPIVWTTQPVVLESDFSSWARMVQLPDGSWLAGYMLTTTPNRIRVKRSFDRMRTWQMVSDIVEPGRDLDNPTFLLRSDGVVVIALRSVIVGQSYWVETYTSADSGNSFQLQSLVDWDEHLGGVYEPFLYTLPDGSIACFYTNEKHRFETPSYSQVLSERVSKDGGVTWGPEIRAISQPGAARPGEANIVPLPGHVLALFYEMCGSENCVGHVSYSPDGVNWPGIGPAVPDTFQDLQAVEMQNGVIVAASNFGSVIVSVDYTNSWIDTRFRPFTFGSWPALYQTAPDEVAMVMTGGGDQGQAGEYIKFGTVEASLFTSPASTDPCRNPNRSRPQNCR